MARLVILDPKADWPRCQICQHRVNPKVKSCEEPHLPCRAGGCDVQEQIQEAKDGAGH